MNMKKLEIITAIDKRISNSKKVDYEIWTIGITNNPERRKGEHGKEHNVKYWRDWKADSENDAREIENHFQDKRVKGGGGGGENPTYVYIF